MVQYIKRLMRREKNGLIIIFFVIEKVVFYFWKMLQKFLIPIMVVDWRPNNKILTFLQVYLNLKISKFKICKLITFSRCL